MKIDIPLSGNGLDGRLDKQNQIETARGQVKSLKCEYRSRDPAHGHDKSCSQTSNLVLK